MALDSSIVFSTLMKETSSTSGGGTVLSASCIAKKTSGNDTGFTIVSVEFDPPLAAGSSDTAIATAVKNQINANRTFWEQVNKEVDNHLALMGKLTRVNTYDIVIDPLN